MKGGESDEVRLRALIRGMRPNFKTSQEFVLETLREAVLEGLLLPRARLRQEELASEFDTSRIPVREALRVLEYEGLVQSEPHRGFTVTGLDADQIEEIYDLRTVLESHAVRLAIPLLTDLDLDDLAQLYEAMEGESDPDARLAYREQFYLCLYGVTARPRLVGLIARLRQEVSRALRRQVVQDSPAHHRVFFDAVREGDADRATAELAAHYRKIGALLRRYLREAKSGTGVGSPRTNEERHVAEPSGRARAGSKRGQLQQP